jgi:hypothetical protein
MKFWSKHITFVIAVLLTATTSLYAQPGGSGCSSPVYIDATTPFSGTNTLNIASGGDFWIEFKIDSATANRYVSLNLTNNGTEIKYDYKVYGPLDSTYNCGALGTEILSGSSFSYTNPVVSGNCITYDETTSSPITFEMTSPSVDKYYMLKITLAPGELSNQQNLSVSSTPNTVVTINSQNTYCTNYTEGTDMPCATNNSCDSSITLCTDYTQTHCPNNCGVIHGRYTRFYVLDIQHPNTIIKFKVSPLSTYSSATYSLSNQMLYGPCDPDLMNPNNLLLSYTGDSTSYTFANTGLYLLNIAIKESECPIVTIDFVDIDSNCAPIVTPPTIDFQAVCTGPNFSNGTAINLVNNGDFELGNHTPSVTLINSDYAYNLNNTVLLGITEYSIPQSPFVAGQTIITNHTPNVGNNGYFMQARAKPSAPSNEYAWKKSVSSFLPNTNYKFEAWFASWTKFTNSSIIDNINLIINGQVVASKNRVTPGVWKKIDYVWNSDTNTTADLRIEIEYNSPVDAGIMFLDDISFTMVDPEMECCNDQEITFDLIATGDTTGATYSWNYGDGSPASPNNTHTYDPGTYTITLDITFLDGSVTTATHTITILDCDYICETCIGSFAPIPGQKYVISAWAKETGATATTTTYDNPEIKLAFNDGNSTVLGPFKPSGDIIDGWQRIEVEFKIPSTAQDMEILLGSASGEVLFDDIRVLPFNANMKSFVYDPINLRLVAELDERHYATYYEYDEQGMLIRVKKETERGIKTIQENRSNTSKTE